MADPATRSKQPPVIVRVDCPFGGPLPRSQFQSATEPIRHSPLLAPEQLGTAPAPLLRCNTPESVALVFAGQVEVRKDPADEAREHRDRCEVWCDEQRNRPEQQTGQGVCLRRHSYLFFTIQQR